ncbi:histidinol-phosphatase HisJ family protein [Halanaerobium hydrogeniformans]|uniref:Histidinol-phosphatase n=1 Tax=Halanaerobium hydrogeniformans TaxID=656519 RepID=E4RKN3_HALHG|nr:histidinol-phosphatase HisJ family protein [Halanaerobium hydrogeniformans]ADQ15680.1 histidinol phosphate phosphatase HisJ family [Halanaerobium hydrogeniformans]
MFFDYHMHSHFSADSQMNMEEIIETAIKIGLDEIAITDHHDIDYKDDSIEFIIDKNEYLTALEKMQNKYKDKIEIKKGIELGVQLHIFDQCNRYLADDFDFVIASFHTAEKKDLYNGDFFEEYSQWEAYLQYLKTVYAVVKDYENYNVIGHLDIIRDYGNYDHKPDLMENKEASEIIAEILKQIIKKDKGIEVNTSGYRIDGENPMPSFRILKLYKELGGEILTIGSDSHSTDRIAQRLSSTSQKLKEIGFDKLSTFTNMKPQFHKIEDFAPKK